MTSNKLPAYFEKYLEQKFGEVREQIAELKTHVNDELMDLKNIARCNQRNIQRLYIISFIIIAYLLLVVEGATLLDLLKTFI